MALTIIALSYKKSSLTIPSCLGGLHESSHHRMPLASVNQMDANAFKGSINLKCPLSSAEVGI